MEEINQDIQDATSSYLVNNPTPNKNLLYTADDTIKYIKVFLQPHNSYPEPPINPIGQFSYPTIQYHLTPDISAEGRTTTAVPYTASARNVSSPDTMSTLALAIPLQIPLRNPVNFSPGIHLTSQGNILTWFHIIH